MKTLAAICLALSLPLPVSAATPETVAGLTESYAHPVLGASSPVQNLTFQSGNLTIVLAAGAAATVSYGGEVGGIFFKGQGTMEFRSSDPAEAAVLTTNVRKATSLKVEPDGNTLVIRDNFEELYLRVAGRKGIELEGSGGAALQQAFDTHREALSRVMSGDPDFAFVKQRIDSPSKPVVRAELRGGRETLLYEYDSVLTESETLVSLHKDRQTSIREYQRALWPVTLSELPIGRNRKAFQEPPWILYDLTYTLTASEKNDATLSIVETIIPRQRAQRVFHFFQLGTIYDSNRNARKFNVLSVKDAAGKTLSFAHREEELLVGLPAATAADEPIEIHFEIAGDFLVRPSGDSYWELGTSPWFPQPDLNGQFYTIHSIVKVKKPFVPFAPGTTVARKEEGDYNVVENRIDKPVQFAVVLAGKYSFEEETQDGLTIRVATYAGKNTRAMKRLTNLAFRIIDFYEPFLGPFPFTEFNIIEINEFGYGQAPPATMFITQEAFNPLQDTLNQIFSKGINHRFAHEIAHQYWGHVVKMGSMDEQWVTESFSEYSSSFVIKAIKGNTDHKSMISTWKANAKDATGSSSIAMANRLGGNGFDSFRNRTHLVYDKGAYLLSRLHNEIGDDHFFSFLRNYQNLYAWKFATTNDMIALLKRLTNRDFTHFFEENFWGTGMPD